MPNPTVSIITSTYNRARSFLPRCIESVQDNTYQHIEHIVVDDGSTDHTKYVCTKRYPKVRYIKNPENFGSDTRPKNIGAQFATGKYLLFLDDDCELRYDAIENLVHVLESQPEVDVVYGDMWLQPSRSPGIACDFDKQRLVLQNYIDTSSALMRREAFEYVGGFDERLPRFVDWNLFLRMAKANFTFQRLPRFTFDYWIHQNSKSSKVPVQTYPHPELGMLFHPTFDPLTCPIQTEYLKPLHAPRVAIFTLHYDRLEYSKATTQNMYDTAGYPFEWFAVDNGSTDGTAQWLQETFSHRPDVHLLFNKTNLGITGGSNLALEEILQKDFDIIIKIDNDVEFLTSNWLTDFVELWEQNHSYYMSPYVEGLKDNPGGAPRLGYSLHGDTLIEVTPHIGGIFAMISARAYKTFRWGDLFLHGNQDFEASLAFREHGYMPCYVPKHRIKHRDGTAGQHQKYQDYFERRKQEKVTSV